MNPSRTQGKRSSSRSREIPATVVAPYRGGAVLKANIIVWSRRVGIDPKYSTLNTTFEEHPDPASGMLCVELRRLLLAGDTVTRKQTVEYPRDWWEAFKARWFPAWALRRWPVVKTRVDVPCEITRVCPHVEIAEHSGKHVQWLNGAD